MQDVIKTFCFALLFIQLSVFAETITPTIINGTTVSPLQAAKVIKSNETMNDILEFVETKGDTKTAMQECGVTIDLLGRVKVINAQKAQSCLDDFSEKYPDSATSIQTLLSTKKN